MVEVSQENVETIDDLSRRLQAYLPDDQVAQVQAAYYYAREAHEGQFRRSGEPYIIHPLAVSGILSGFKLDHQSLMAALLHDVLEDTDSVKQEIVDLFGQSVADLVDGVSKLTQISFRSKAHAQAENFQKMAMAMAKDIRVILIKLADRTHNMRTLGVLRRDKQQRIAKETLEIYAPIANRLGMNAIRIELEDMSFRMLYPMRARRIEAALSHVQDPRNKLIDKIQTQLTDKLTSAGISCEVIGRQKHLYSIYQKMRAKKKAFSEIMDVFAFRIVLNNLQDCYRALGLAHELYKPVPGRFKDYIAIPKTNGYQSLHSILIAADGVPVEVQIRTEEMDQKANHGVAAHWLYKTATEEPANDADFLAQRWLKSLLELQASADDSLEFIENVKVDLFPDEVYVFSPKGRIFDLPKGATAVDFAYAVHTDIGNQCVACRIDRRLAPLSEPLQSGQTIQIITSNHAQPSAAWLSCVVTGKAKSSIRQYMKTQKRDQSIALGKRLLSKALVQLETDVESLPAEIIQATLGQTGFDSLDDMLEEIGLGQRMAHVIARQFATVSQTINEAVDEESAVQDTHPDIVIEGTEGLVLTYAKCCRPVAGDDIVGYLSAGRGIIVHRDGCHNVNSLLGDAEKCVSLSWKEDYQAEFSVELACSVLTEENVLSEFVSVVARMGCDLERVGFDKTNDRNNQLGCIIKVRDRVHLANVIRQIKKLAFINKITRV